MKNSQYTTKNEYFSSLAPDWDNEVGNDKKRISIVQSHVQNFCINNGDTVIDLGCGTGILLPYLSNLVSKQGRIIAIDAAPGMITEAKKKHSHLSNIEFHTEIIEDMQLSSESVDTVVAFAVFPHIENKRGALQVIRNCIKPGGHLYIFHLANTASLNSFHANLDAPVNVDRLPDKDEMDDLLQQTNFSMHIYIDQPDFNYIEAVPCYI